MPDISMCRAVKCPLRHKCYRYTALPGYWQTYANFNPKNCKHFWNNEGTKISEESIEDSIEDFESMFDKE